MSLEVIVTPDIGVESRFFLKEYSVDHIYDKCRQAPKIALQSQGTVGGNVIFNEHVFHLPCFQTNSDELCHIMTFRLLDKTVEVLVM
jgi:homogentisate 1,2-dioxygenase